MRVLLILVLLAIGMFSIGWMTYSKNSQQAAITIQTEKIKEDAERVIEKGKQVSEDAGRKAREKLDALKEEKKTAPEGVPATK